MTAVTRHAEQRIRGRLGLPKRAIARAAGRAWTEGVRARLYRGAFRVYLDGVAEQESAGREVRVYGQAVYVFAADEALITAWPVPGEYLRAAAHPSSVASAASGAGVDHDAPPSIPGPKSQGAGLSEVILPTDPTTAPTPFAARERLPERTIRTTTTTKEDRMSDPHSGTRAAGNGSAWGGLSSSTPAGSAVHGPGGTPAPSGGESSAGNTGHSAAKSAGNGSAWSGLGAKK